MRELFINRQYKKARDIGEDFFSLDNSDAGRTKGYQENDKFLGKFLSEKQINYFLVFILVGFFVLFVRIFYLQAIKGDYYSKLAEINRTRENPLIASRGLIYDKNNKPLVKNIPIFDALILPKDLSLAQDKRDEEIKAIAQVLQVDPLSISAILDKHPKNFKYQLAIKENLDYEQALSLMIKAKQLTGLYIQTRDQRQYLYPYEFSHLIGYEGKITEAELAQKGQQEYLFNDYIGKSGLELSYEPILRGEYGKESIEIDVTGQEKKVLYREEPISGQSLILTIDEQVQKAVRDILLKDLKRFNKKRASIVMLNPQNGEVISLVSFPDYDENQFALGISVSDYQLLVDNPNNPLFERAVKGEFPSGSTIKPVIAAGALEDKVITDKTTFLSTGGLTLYDRWFFPDWSATGHGLTNVYKAIAWSVNTFFYEVGGGYEDFKGLGVEGLDKYFKMFGLGQKTGIDLPGEANGLVPDPDWKKKIKGVDWYIGDTYHLAIGQGDLLVTPLQVANYMNVFGNGGKLYQPHLVKEIVDNNGNKQTIEPKIIRENFISPKNLDIVKRAMRQTVTSGSAPLLNQLNVAVYGKTGTAQWKTDALSHAWFAGLAPYDNPEVAIVVLVEEGGEGSTVSVPIAYDVLNWYFNTYKKQQIANGL